MITTIDKTPDGELIYYFLEEDAGENYPFLWLDLDEGLVSTFRKHLSNEPERLLDFNGWNAPLDSWNDWVDICHHQYWKLKDIELKRLKFIKKPVFKSWNWLTIAPRPMLDINEDLDKFEEYIKSIMNPLYFEEFKWVIESGKSESCPNVHAHILYCFKNEKVGKNWKRDSCRRYDRVFKTEQGIDWFNAKGKGWFNKVFRSKDTDFINKIVKDKKEYCDNFSKSAIHQNYCDLNLSGEYP
jgi:hypothetical protein